MPEILKEGNYTGDIVKYEVPEYSREKVTIPSGTGKLTAGTVLENGTSGYVPVSFTAATTDPQAAAVVGTPAAVLIEDVDATSASATALVVVQHAVVVEQKLVLDEEMDDDSKASVMADLASLGIVARKGA